MDDLDRHFDPYAIAEPKSPADRILILEELLAEIENLKTALDLLSDTLDRL